MRVVLDTNVFVSGVFFTGPPYAILNAWRAGKVQLVVSDPVLEEYHRVGEELAREFGDVELRPALRLLATHALRVAAPPLPEPVCRDRDDDKFLACAAASNTKHVVSGDGDLLAVSGYRGITVLRPRDFVEKYLTPRDFREG